VRPSCQIIEAPSILLKKFISIILPLSGAIPRDKSEHARSSSRMRSLFRCTLRCAYTRPRAHAHTRVHECLEWRAPRMVVSTRVITCLVHHKARTWPDVICRGPRKTRPTSQRFNTRPRAVGSLSKCRKSNCPGVHRFIICTRAPARVRAALRCVALRCASHR